MHSKQLRHGPINSISACQTLHGFKILYSTAAHFYRSLFERTFIFISKSCEKYISFPWVAMLAPPLYQWRGPWLLLKWDFKHVSLFHLHYMGEISSLQKDIKVEVHSSTGVPASTDIHELTLTPWRRNQYTCLFWSRSDPTLSYQLRLHLCRASAAGDRIGSA